MTSLLLDWKCILQHRSLQSSQDYRVALEKLTHEHSPVLGYFSGHLCSAFYSSALWFDSFVNATGGKYALVLCNGPVFIFIRFILQKPINVNIWMASCLQIIHCGNLVQSDGRWTWQTLLHTPARRVACSTLSHADITLWLQCGVSPRGPQQQISFRSPEWETPC